MQGGDPNPGFSLLLKRRGLLYVIAAPQIPHVSQSVVSSLRGFESWSSNLGESLKRERPLWKGTVN